MDEDVLTLFDLDHTLVPHDSEQLWVDFLVAEGLLDALEVTTKSLDLTERYNRGEAAAIEFSEFYLGLMAPHDPVRLDGLRDRWTAERVRPRIAPAARTLVERHRLAGDRVVVSTAVFRYLAEPQAAEFDIEHLIATDPERVDGRFTGRVAGCPRMRPSNRAARNRMWRSRRGFYWAS